MQECERAYFSLPKPEREKIKKEPFSEKEAAFILPVLCFTTKAAVLYNRKDEIKTRR